MMYLFINLLVYYTWNNEDCCMGVLAGNVSEELHIVPVPLDTIQAGLLHVELEVAVELHHVPRLDHGGQLQLLIQSNTMNS